MYRTAELLAPPKARPCSGAWILAELEAPRSHLKIKAARLRANLQVELPRMSSE